MCVARLHNLVIFLHITLVEVSFLQSALEVLFFYVTKQDQCN